MKISYCCGAIIYPDTDICSDCKEHCSAVCPDCNGEGYIDEIDYKRVNSTSIDVPYKLVICQFCDGQGFIEVGI